MNLLLDTHIALWAITDDPRLSGKARDLILDEANSSHVSAVSIWEIAIKHSLSRGVMPVSAAEAAQAFRDSGFSVLAIAPDHAVA
ncbi:MAG: type II toxin-antitoxin system VapC family toxin, partial [Bifidobacteriaceae bacterium]|nr:type II toxin-antitoxin system VapC family toxin [Bifidobacteriaceae bacterium]